MFYYVYPVLVAVNTCRQIIISQDNTVVVLKDAKRKDDVSAFIHSFNSLFAGIKISLTNLFNMVSVISFGINFSGKRTLLVFAVPVLV